MTLVESGKGYRQHLAIEGIGNRLGSGADGTVKEYKIINMKGEFNRQGNDQKFIDQSQKNRNKGIPRRHQEFRIHDSIIFYSAKLKNKHY